MKSVFFNIAAAIATIVVCFIAGEALLRLKNADGMSYHVEMWRYAKELKQRVEDPLLSHIHIPSKSAKLQNTTISINSLGMRGPEIDKQATKKRILFLGSSITLGWGTPEDETLSAILQSKFGNQAEILNAGVGNYNTERYTRLYETHLRQLKPEVLVVHYFINDAEVLPPASNNILIQNSQLALMLWQGWVKMTAGEKDMSGLEEHYQAIYNPENEGYKRMFAALRRLAEMAKQDGTQVILAMMPDIHNLKPYPFTFIHKQMAAIATTLKWEYVDLYPALENQIPEDLYTIPGDPHPNGLGHRLMADHLYPVLEDLIR